MLCILTRVADVYAGQPEQLLQPAPVAVPEWQAQLQAL